MKNDIEKHSLSSVRSAWRREVESTAPVSEFVVTRALATAQEEIAKRKKSPLPIGDFVWGAVASVALTIVMYIPASQYMTGLDSDGEISLNSTSTDLVAYIMQDRVSEAFVE